jgi:hypothetical protein
VENKPVIATELLKGQGLGNQLFIYVAIRCLALENNCDFAILNREILANNIHSNKGMYFMDLDCGLEKSKEELKNVYSEKEERLYIGNSFHDIDNGCYITGEDEDLFNIRESTLIYGNLQDESYFRKYKPQIKQWLKVKPEYDNYDYSRENLCVINIRGGEYTSSPELFLRRKYWLDAMKIMKNKRADMEFVVVTDDFAAAKRILPEVEAHHFDLAGDYTAIKNAHYLIMSNSTFAFFPAYTSETLKFAIAPKYWARHNVSDGYWASEQNIYSDFMYMDRKGKLYTADECRKELEGYKKTSKRYKNIGVKLTGIQLSFAMLNAKRLIYNDLFIRMLRSLKRRITRLVVTR